MDELLYEGCWLESSSGFNVMQSSSCSNPPRSLIDHSHYLPSCDSNSGLSTINPHHQIYQEDTEASLTDNQSNSFGVETYTATDIARRLWIGPRAYTGPCSSVRERLMLAIGYFKQCTKDKDVLIQIWVPIKRGGRQMLLFMVFLFSFYVILHLLNF